MSIVKTMNPLMSNKRALVLSGGGAKGGSSLEVISQLDDEIGDINKFYDLMCGSSVGAISAAVLASGALTANEYRDIFDDAVRKIFKKHWFPFKFPKYDRKNFIKVWNKLMGDKKDMKFGEVKTKLIITSVDFVTDETTFFKSWKDKWKDEKLLDVVLRSFAAPMYFGHIVDEKHKAVWTDGGVGADNLPLNFAIYEGLKNEWFHKDDKYMHIDSVGCLEPIAKKSSFDQVKKHKMLRQVMDFSKFGEGGLARVASTKEQVSKTKYLISSNKLNLSVRYYDAEIPKKKDGMDKLQYLGYYREMGNYMADHYIDL